MRRRQIHPRLVRPPQVARGSRLTQPASQAGRTAHPLEATDPRWTLALRVRERMQGTLLAPTDRETLIRQGRTMGLSAFEANLVIAIVQDHARRGLHLDAAASMLQLVPHHRRQTSPRPVGWTVAAWCTAAIAMELLILWALL